MDTEQDYEIFKIVLLGDGEVGKTHLMSRFAKEELPNNPVPTIGVEFNSKVVSLKNGNQVKLQIWDTAGQERYRAITKMYFKGAYGALVLFDLTKFETFENVNKWIKEIRDQAPEIVIILVGSKLDLIYKDPQERQVDINLAMNYAKEQNIKYFESSSFTGESINEIFASLVEDIVQQKEIQQ
ncbi:hypothetical protein pb186bvf_001013 [Paramecium bursaria]